MPSTTLLLAGRDPALPQSITLVTFIWGFSIACAVFTMAKAAKQTYRAWKRSHVMNTYIIMIWSEWFSCVAISIISWLYLSGIIAASLEFFICLLCLWTIQIHCIMQIIINRIALILYNPKLAIRLKWIAAITIGLINISVFCIWIPARLGISPEYIRINEVWDRTEKCMFLVMDASLNAYFMWLIKTKLVNAGLDKYRMLYKFNLCMVCLSISLDALIVGVMSLPSDVVYIQVHPLTYLIKLHIEMRIAELIGKIIKSSHSQPSSLATTEQHDMPARNASVRHVSRNIFNFGGDRELHDEAPRRASWKTPHCTWLHNPSTTC